MRNRFLLWAIAVVLTLTSAVYQRVTGPTHPIRGDVRLGDRVIRVKLLRSHAGSGDQPVRVPDPAGDLEADVAWRRYPTSDSWQILVMERRGDALEALLPHQPPSGKIEYQVRLKLGNENTVFPPRPAITRFKGSVSAFVLVPHVVFMFVGMLLSTRAGLEALSPTGRPRRMSSATLLCLAVGGLFLGPLVQKAAFGAWWTGWPFGMDLTDNKTLIAAVVWLWAVLAQRKKEASRLPVIVAAAVTLIVFAIPHSAWGSELDWERVGRS
jgi:hypothetical protein